MTIADRTTHCDLCHLPLFLYENTVGSICADCSAKVTINVSPCDKCGRWHTYQFWCGVCGIRVCDGCVHQEHGQSGECQDDGE